MLLSKKQFLDCIDFIKTKTHQELKLSKMLEELSPGTHCDLFLYSGYENLLISILQIIFNDTSELISYKLYEFDDFDPKTKSLQLQETPELETWESLYDYLISQPTTN